MLTFQQKASKKIFIISVKNINSVFEKKSVFV